MSQTHLAKAVDLSRSNIASYESGVVEPNANNFLKLCSLLNIPPNQMLVEILSDSSFEKGVEQIIEERPMSAYLREQLDAFTLQTNNMTRILEGYREFYLLQKENDKLKNYKGLYQTLEQTLDLMESLVKTNWEMIQNLNPSSEEE